MDHWNRTEGPDTRFYKMGHVTERAAAQWGVGARQGNKKSFGQLSRETRTPLCPADNGTVPRSLQI